MKWPVAASAGIRSLNIVASCVLTVMLAGVLGRDGYGIYSYALVTVMVVSVLVQLGVPRLVLRETAKALVTDDYLAITRIWRWAARLCLIASAAAIVIAIGIVNFFVTDPDLRQVMILAIFLVPLLSFSALWSGALRGLGHVLLGQLPDFVIRPMVLLALISLGIAALDQLRPDQAMLLNLAAALVAFSIGTWALLRKAPSFVRAAKPSGGGERGWAAASLTMAFTAGMMQINGYADILLLGAIRGTDESGAYRIAQQMAILTASGLHVASMVYAPQLARAHKSGDTLALSRLMNANARLAFGVASLVALGLAIGAPTAISHLLGGDFKDAYAPIVILSFGQVLSAFFGTVGVLLNMSGLEREAARAMVIGAIGNIVLNLALIPSFGAWGAALATSSTLLIWNLLMWRAARQNLNIDCTALGGGR